MRSRQNGLLEAGDLPLRLLPQQITAPILDTEGHVSVPFRPGRSLLPPNRVRREVPYSPAVRDTVSREAAHLS